jgi:hypothetical protein
MTVTTPSSHKFDEDASRTMNAAQIRRILITDRGHPTHVALTMQVSHRRPNDSDRSTFPARRGGL